jgi:hypothetical protein
MKPAALPPMIAIAALIAGGSCLWLDSRRPDPPRNPLLDLPTPEALRQQAELRIELAALELAARLEELDKAGAEAAQPGFSERLHLHSSFSRALEPGSGYQFPFIGLVSRDLGGKVSACERWRGRIPSDYAAYLDHIVEPVAGKWLIGRMKLEGEMTYSFRFCHEVATDGRLLGLDLPDPVMLEDLRTQVAKLPAPR